MDAHSDFLKRLSRRPEIAVFVGLLLLVSAAGLMWLNVRALSAREAKTLSPNPPQTVLPATASVLMTRGAIYRGQIIGPEDFVERSLAGPAPADLLTRAVDAVGHVALADLHADQIVFRDLVSPERSAAGVAALVPVGQRAFALRVAEEDIVGGFLQPGDRVDIFVTLPGSIYPQHGDNGKDGDQSKGALLLQDVSVLAVGDVLSANGKVNAGVRTATLALTPEALAQLALAGRLGRVALAIRNPIDHARTVPRIAEIGDLAPHELNAPTRDVRVKNHAAPAHRVTVYSGAQIAAVHVTP